MNLLELIPLANTVAKLTDVWAKHVEAYDRRTLAMQAETAAMKEADEARERMHEESCRIDVERLTLAKNVLKEGLEVLGAQARRGMP